MGYPCLRYIKHPSVEEYEDSEISDKDRSTDSFVEWIKSKTGDSNIKIKRIMGGKNTKRNKNKPLKIKQFE